MHLCCLSGHVWEGNGIDGTRTGHSPVGFRVGVAPNDDLTVVSILVGVSEGMQLSF